MVKDSPVFKDALKDFLDFAGDMILVGHNIHSFDMKFIKRNAKNYWGSTIGNDDIDTLQLARQFLPQLPHHRLVNALLNLEEYCLGKKSIRENKSIYQLAREEAGLTREEASESMEFISDSRIEKYESGKSLVQPEEVMAMAKAYKKPALCNYYCSHECPIGQEYVPEVEMKDLAQIVLKTLASMNSVEKAKDRFIEITADGEITDDELLDFARIEAGIEEISMAADSLSLWVENTIAAGRIDEEKLEEARKQIKK